MILENNIQPGYVVAVITAAEASIRNADQLKDEVVALIDGGQKKIILSFERVTYIDSSFLGSMVAALKHAIAKGADIYLVHLSSDINDLLSLIRMNKVFKIYDTADQAIENIG